MSKVQVEAKRMASQCVRIAQERCAEVGEALSSRQESIVRGAIMGELEPIIEQQLADFSTILLNRDQCIDELRGIDPDDLLTDGLSTITEST